jgi:hypothetical protein
MKRHVGVPEGMESDATLRVLLRLFASARGLTHAALVGVILLM